MNTYIGCSAIIYDEGNKVLIAQRSKYKKFFPLYWETVGGALEDNETPEDCIRREVQEEINCNIHDLKIFKVYIINKLDRFVLIVYTGRVNEPIQPNPEIEQIRWIDKAEIDKFDFYSNEREKLTDYYKQN
jgi:8-oxo-dGTP diphosphatase